MKRHPFRVLIRLLTFGLFVSFALADFIINIWLRGRASYPRVRADWLHRWSRRHLRILDVEISRRGEPPSGGLLISNHLSYLDVLVLAAAQPMIFLSKSEVQSWPLFGWLTRCAGTLYIRRERKADVARVASQLASVVDEGIVLVIFPEGTSTDGNKLLPFRSSLFAPAAEKGWPVTPTWVGYSLADGSVEQEICYWGDMTFVPHILNLFSKARIRVQVVYAPTFDAGPDRKELARQLHAQVCELAAVHGGRRLGVPVLRGD